MKIIHGGDFLRLTLTEKIASLLKETLINKGQKICNTIVPEAWIIVQSMDRNQAHEKYSRWYSEIVISGNTIKSGGVCHIEGQNSAINQYKNIIRTHYGI